MHDMVEIPLDLGARTCQVTSTLTVKVGSKSFLTSKNNAILTPLDWRCWFGPNKASTGKNFETKMHSKWRSQAFFAS